jgi:hypothetical protein
MENKDVLTPEQNVDLNEMEEMVSDVVGAACYITLE